MKVAITTLGSRGDLQPYIALGLGLQAAGFEVQVVSSKNEEQFVKNYGLDFYPLSVDIANLMNNKEVQEMSKGSNPLKFITSHLKSSKSLKQIMLQTQEELYKSCKDADIIIFHPGTTIGFFIAKQHQKIAILATPFPVVPTAAYPSILFYSFPKLGKIYNKLTHYIFDKVFWALGKSAIKDFWNTNLQSKMNFSSSALTQHIEAKGLILNGYSKHLFAPPPDWTNNIQTTGTWFLETEPSYIPPQALIDFIENGEQPIYIGFGSMKELDFQSTLRIISDSLAKTGQRAVVGLGWTDYKHAEIHSNIFLIQSVPHTWLFPQMKIVVHHGGAGTTATGLRAGKPTIIIPHNADQPAWGKRVYELGLGSKPIAKNKLSSNNLSEAIMFAMQPQIVENAKNFGHKMQQEGGVSEAVNAVVKFLQNNRISS